MKRKVKYFFIGLTLLWSAVSCIEDQNFDQFDDLSITPTIESSIIYVESPESIINSVSDASLFSSDFNFEAFKEAYFAERVLEGSITYGLENTTSKELDILFEFLDEDSNSLDSEHFLLDPEPTAVLQREVFYGGAGRSLDIIVNTSTIRVSINNIGDNISVSSLPNPKITLKSSAKFRIRIK